MNPKPYSIDTDSASGESFTVTDYYEGGKHVGRLIRGSEGNAVHREGRWSLLDIVLIDIPDSFPWESIPAAPLIPGPCEIVKVSK